MNSKQIVEKLDTPEMRNNLHKVFKETATSLISNKKRNTEIVEYVVIKNCRTHSVDSEGKKIRKPGTFPDPETGSELTAWGRSPGEVISLKNFSPKIQLIANKQILPVEVFCSFVKEHIDETFSEAKLKTPDNENILSTEKRKKKNETV